MKKEVDKLRKIQAGVLIISMLAILVQIIMSIYHIEQGFLLACWTVGLFLGIGFGIIISKEVLL